MKAAGRECFVLDGEHKSKYKYETTNHRGYSRVSGNGSKFQTNLNPVMKKIIKPGLSKKSIF